MSEKKISAKDAFKRYFRTVAGSVSFLKGFSVTVKYFFQPRRIVTEQYPEDENGDNVCTACGMCERNCPNGSINVLSTKNIAGKKVLGKYIYRLDSCTQCGLCVEACPFGAIRMNQDFELSRTSRDGFEMKLNQKEGRA